MSDILISLKATLSNKTIQHSLSSSLHRE